MTAKTKGIFSTAYRIHANNPCEDGRQRGLDALAKFGYGRFTPLPLTFCLENVGLLDTLFSLGFVDPSCTKMAQEALARFRRDIILPLNPPAQLLDIADRRIRGSSWPLDSGVDKISRWEKSLGLFEGRGIVANIVSTTAGHVQTIELSRILINRDLTAANAEIENQKHTLMGILKSYE